MASELFEKPAADSIPKRNTVGRDSISRLVMESCLPDLDGTVQACVQMSMEGVGGLGIEHWVGNVDDRPFRSADNVGYRALLEFVNRNRERVSDSQNFLHYIWPWYDWALGTAESKLLVTLMSRSDCVEASKDELVEQIREAVLNGFKAM